MIALHLKKDQVGEEGSQALDGYYEWAMHLLTKFWNDAGAMYDCDSLFKLQNISTTLPLIPVEYSEEYLAMEKRFVKLMIKKFNKNPSENPLGSGNDHIQWMMSVCSQIKKGIRLKRSVTHVSPQYKARYRKTLFTRNGTIKIGQVLMHDTDYSSMLREDQYYLYKDPKRAQVLMPHLLELEQAVAK